MTIDDTIQRLQSGLRELRRRDPELTVFGASQHQYRVNDVADEASIVDFEARFGIRLPEGYRAFLLSVGNGGAGPYYGIETLEDLLFSDLDFKNEDHRLDPSVPFPLREAWNLGFDDDAVGKEDDESLETGLLRICNFGCGISMNLIVNGPEYGNIWVDDRANDGGIFPDTFFDQTGRSTFLDWYHLWLQRSLESVGRLPC